MHAMVHILVPVIPRKLLTSDILLGLISKLLPCLTVCITRTGDFFFLSPREHQRKLLVVLLILKGGRLYIDIGCSIAL